MFVFLEYGGYARMCLCLLPPLLLGGGSKKVKDPFEISDDLKQLSAVAGGNGHQREKCVLLWRG